MGLVGKDVRSELVLGWHLFIQNEVEILRIFKGDLREGLMLWGSLPIAGMSDFWSECWGERDLGHTDLPV